MKPVPQGFDRAHHVIAIRNSKFEEGQKHDRAVHHDLASDAKSTRLDMARSMPKDGIADDRERDRQHYRDERMELRNRLVRIR